MVLVRVFLEGTLYCSALYRFCAGSELFFLLLTMSVVFCFWLGGSKNRSHVNLSQLLFSGTLVVLPLTSKQLVQQIYATLPASPTVPSLLDTFFSPFHQVCTQEDICSSIDQPSKIIVKRQRYVIEKDPSGQR